MIQFALVLVVLIMTLFMQVLDDFLSQRGVISVLHGGLLGYGQIYAAKLLLDWGGGTLGWLVVVFIALGAMAVSYYKIMNTWTRWVCAFNFGILVGILYGGFNLV